jgi:peptide/nickel transport system substrate-binding protein
LIVRSTALKAVAVAAVFALAAVSCAGEEPADTDTEGDAAAAEEMPEGGNDEAPGSEDGEPGEAEIVGEGETLSMNWGGFPENWTPGADYAIGYLRVPYETLVTYDADGELVGQLATGWEQDDQGQITFTLREGVTFHDGEPFDAEAVRASIEAMKQAQTVFAGPVQVISDVEVIDDLTVRLNTDGNAPSLLQSLTTLSGFMFSPAALENGILTEQPVGTGPWAFDADASSSSRLVFNFYERYWDGRESVGFDTIEMVEVDDDQAAAGAVQSGELDLTTTEVQFFDQFDGTTNVEYLQYPAIRNGIVFFDRGPGGLFEDADVRRAACYAIDESVVSQIEQDIVPTTQQFGEGEPGHNPDIDDYPHDLDRAQELFESAGSPPIQAEMLATFFNEDQNVVYADQMSQIGINVSVQTVPPPQWFGAWNSGEYPMGIASHSEIHPFDWYQSWFAEGAPNNPAGVESEELREAAEAALAAGASDEADGLWAEVMGIISDEALICGRMIGQSNVAWNTDTVSNVSAPHVPWEPNLVSLKDLRFAG